jgi:hypothetical protein
MNVASDTIIWCSYAGIFSLNRAVLPTGVISLRPPRIVRYEPALAIIGLTLLFLHRLALTDLILARGDTFAYFYPYWHARSAAFMAGELPLWSPDLFMGVPLLANSQIGTFYPPNWLVAPFSPPDGLRISILLHVTWAMAGTYLLARRALGTDRLAALLAAAVFGLGGYIGGHVEQINQLQGLSWMPWLFLLFDRAIHSPVRGTLFLGMGLSLQFFTGHTQTVFITVSGLGIYALCSRQGRAFATLFGAGFVALLLSMPQLLPTLEMTGVSNRRGGLNPNQATAFSLSPFVLGRGMLPSYDLMIFGEYVAYAGVIGLGLAVVGMFASLPHPRPLSHVNGERGENSLRSLFSLVWGRTAGSGVRSIQPRFLHRIRWGQPLSARVTWMIIALVGLALAFGVYNPLYWWLATLPGFNLFRVPARWLALFALAAAMLAALGLQSLNGTARPRVKILVLAAVVILLLMIASALTLRQPDLTPVSLPTTLTFVGWGAALIVLLALLWMRQRTLLVAAALIELLLAAFVLPYNDLSSPEVFDHPRFTTYQLLAYKQQSDSPIFGRLLSISELLYDPGDRFALEARFRALGMSQEATRTAFTAIKMQDTLAANLPVLYGLPSADGFDGGLLPTSYYTAFTSLLLPEGELRSIDGRLREILARPESCEGACIPDQRWLNLMNVHYLITDKIHDLWLNDIAYDTTFKYSLDAGQRLHFEVVPPFEATVLHLLVRCPDDNCPAFTARLTDSGGMVMTVEGQVERQHENQHLLQLPLEVAFAPLALALEADAPVTVAATTLVDTRTGDFQQLQPMPWQRVLSSDIELYQNTAPLPRAFVVHDVRFVPDNDVGSEMALDGMRDAAFNPAVTAYISGDAAPVAALADADTATPTPVVTEYSPTRVAVTTQTDAPAYLVLADAYYPGWTATVNGEPAEVRRADVMFRAVAIPEGESRVVFEYRPSWFPSALIVGGLLWLLVGGVLIIQKQYKIP